MVLATNLLLLRHAVKPNPSHPLGVAIIRRVATHEYNSKFTRHRFARVLELKSMGNMVFGLNPEAGKEMDDPTREG